MRPTGPPYVCLEPTVTTGLGLHISHRYIGLSHFFFLLSSHQSPGTIRICIKALYDTICRPLKVYNINLRAATIRTLSIRGVTIPIYLVSSTTDSIRQRVVLFKPVTILTSDPKSEFLCQSSLCCAEPADPLNHLVRLGYLPCPQTPCIIHTITVQVLSQSTLSTSYAHSRQNILVAASQFKSNRMFPSNVTLTQTSHWLPLPSNT